MLLSRHPEESLAVLSQGSPEIYLHGYVWSEVNFTAPDTGDKGTKLSNVLKYTDLWLSCGSLLTPPSPPLVCG